MSRKYIPTNIRQAVRERAHGCCEYCLCQADYATEIFVTEHILPLSKGGTDDLDNLALSCTGCNGHKYNKTEAVDPINDTMVSLYNPRLHHWHDHFRWSNDFTQIVGQTDIGRATINELHLNRIPLINIRYALSFIDKHPPEFFFTQADS